MATDIETSTDSKSLAYDVVIVGGAVAGASTALLLRRRHPELRVLVIEKNPAFDWKVGESMVEVSSYFVTRVLQLYDYLSREQLAKQSFRFWFHHGHVRRLREASEVGPTQLARLPAFQLDRSTFDEHLLQQAAVEGAEVWRPAKAIEIRLADETGEANNVIVVERGAHQAEVRSRWVVDATGRIAMIARKKNMLHALEEHPTAAVWARFRNVKDLDGPEVWGHNPADPLIRCVIASRRLATNHFTGYGYWIWLIPLKSGHTSVGLVWDKRLVEPPGQTAQEKLLRFLHENPLTCELMEHAVIEPGDARMYGHLPYLVDRVAGRGWSLVGDAAGFLDPFYSPGLDQMSFSVSWTLELIKRSLTNPAPDAFNDQIDDHNQRYSHYMRYLFESIYKDKYYLMGDYDTMTASFLIDTALYYLFVSIPLYRWSSDRVLVPPFYQDHAHIAKRIMSFYQGRLISIAKRKRALGIYGNHNAGTRPTFVGFSVRSGAYVMLAHGLARWLKAEAANAWSYVRTPKPMAARMPIPPAPATSKISLSLEATTTA